MGEIWQPERALVEKGREGPRPGAPGSVRLLVCDKCKTIDELPAYSGPAEDIDPLLDRALHLRHGPHRDDLLRGEGIILHVWRDEWDDEASDYEKRREIVKAIRESQGHTGLGDDFYATHNTYREEAMKCFNAHRRPTECIDYQTHSKLLGNTLTDSAEVSEMAGDLGRSKRELARSMFQARQKIYLCSFCPVESVVMQKKAGTL